MGAKLAQAVVGGEAFSARNAFVRGRDVEISGIIQRTGNRIVWHWDTTVPYPLKTTPTEPTQMKASNALVAAALAGVFSAGTVAHAAMIPGKDKEKDDCPGKDKEKKEELAMPGGIVISGEKDKDKDDCPDKDKEKKKEELVISGEKDKDKDDCPDKDKEKKKEELVISGEKDKDKDDCPDKDKEKKKEELVISGEKEKEKDDCPDKDKKKEEKEIL